MNETLQNLPKAEKPVVRGERDHSIVQTPKTVSLSPTKGKWIDPSIVAFKYYNCFNYPFLSKENRDVYFTMGITSANPGEGKTLVASNLAVSLALGYQKRTIIVDLNMIHPRIHEIFGTALSPGLYEALHDGTVVVTPTQMENLSVLSAGAPRARRGGAGQHTNGSANPAAKQDVLPPIGLEYLPAFREVLASLEQHYDFIIVDMPSINAKDFPILYASQLNGLVVVVDTGKTRRDEIAKMFRHVNEHQVLGFVFNRVQDDSL